MILRRLLKLVVACAFSVRFICEGYENLDGELLKASEAGDVVRTMELVEKGAIIDCRNNFGVSPLIFAANNNHLETLRVLVEHKADVEARSNDGRSALIWASIWAHSDVIIYLLENGASIDVRDRRGMTALMHAAFENHTAVVQLLVDRGADVHAENVYKGTALSISQLNNNKKAADIIQRKCDSRDEENYGKIAAFLGNALEQTGNLILHFVLRLTRRMRISSAGESEL
jgi:ankyrin repeat protein